MVLQHSAQTRNLLMQSKWTYQGNKKIFESPDGGKTVFERDMGSDQRREITHPQQLLIRKILPIDVFYKLFKKENASE